MKKQTLDKERKVDLDKLSPEQREELSKNLAKFTSDKINTLVSEIRDITRIYGVDFNVMYELTPLGFPPVWKNPEWHASMAKQKKTLKKTASKNRASSKKITKKTKKKKS